MSTVNFFLFVGAKFVGETWPPTFMYVTLRARRANEGGTTDLPDYSETVHRERTLFTN